MEKSCNVLDIVPYKFVTFYM